MNPDHDNETSNGYAALVAGILRSFERQQRYAQSLVADLSPAEMVSQPIDGVVLNHPAWALSHLNVYMPVLTAMLEGGTPGDPLDHEFGQRSTPLPDPGAYLPKAALLERFAQLHESTARAFRAAGPGVLAAETPLPRFIERFPTIGDVAIQLMIKHEATHLGQVSAWRRAGGRPMVTP